MSSVSSNNTANDSLSSSIAKSAVFLSFEFALIGVEAYLFVALTYFLFKKNLCAKRKKKKNGNLLLFLVVLVLLFGIIKCSVVVYAFLSPVEQSHDHCDLIEKTYQGITTIGIAVLYVFLWARQYSLYKEPQLQVLVPTWVANFSKYLLIPLILSCLVGLVTLVVFGSAEHYVYVPGTNTCAFKIEVDPNEITLFVCMGIVQAFNACILFLFVYILRRHDKEMLLYDVKPKSERRVLNRVIRNCTIAAAVTMVTDPATVVLDATLPRTLSQPVFLFIWDVNYMINIICLLACFMNWSKMVFPWCLNKIKSRLPS